jgi:cGMP-dependent protein kinase
MGTGCMKMKNYQQLESRGPDTSNYTRVPKKVKRNQVLDENMALKDTNAKRRKSIFNPNYQEAEAGRKVESPVKTDDDKSKIITALNNHFIFTSLTDEDKEMVAEAMELYDFPQDSVVFLQDMPSKSYYVVKEGTLEVIVNNKRVNKIHAGEGFGELALLQDNPRSATLKCLEPTLLWGVDRNTFRKVIEEMNTAIYEQNRQFLEKVTLLTSLKSPEKDILAANLVSYKYHQDQKIITEGETGNQLYIIKEGTVIVMRGTNPVAEYGPGSYFGEYALLNNTPRTATCVAKTFVKCMCLSRETLQKVLSNKLQNIIETNTVMEAINKSETLSILTKEQKEAIIKDLHEKNYKGGDVVIPVGSQCKSKIYIIITGRLQYAKASTMLIDKGNCVGDVYVTKSHAEDLKYEDDLIAAGDMKIGEITKYQFEISIKGKYEEVIKENAATNVLKKVSLFSSLEATKMKDLFNMIKNEKYNPDEIILREGNQSSFVYIVKRGRVDAFKAGNLAKTITKHNYFGERTFLKKGSSNYTFVANGNVTLWCISNADFESLSTKEILESLMYRCKLEDEEVELHNLIVVKQLGKGMFAKVFLVKTESGEYYALKGVSRRKINKFAINEQLIVTIK